jgi:hypothetical protein
MSPTLDDLRAQKEARALLVKAADRIQKEGPFTDSRAAAEYGAGINAYDQGRYIETIVHMHAAMVSGHVITVKN